MRTRVMLRFCILIVLPASFLCGAQEKPAGSDLRAYFAEIETAPAQRSYEMMSDAWRVVHPNQAFTSDEISTIQRALNRGNEPSVEAALRVSILYLSAHPEAATSGALAAFLPIAKAHFSDNLPSLIKVNGETGLEETSLKCLILAFIRVSGKQPEPQMVSWMLTKLKTTQIQECREEIIKSLAHLSPPREDAIDALVGVLGKRDIYASVTVLNEIVSNHLDTENLRSAILSCLDAPDPVVRRTAIYTASDLGLTGAEPALQLLTRDADPSVSEAAGQALRTLTSGN